MSVRGLTAAAVTVLAFVGGAVAFHMYTVAPRWLQVRRLRIGLVGLPDDWRGLRIAHLSDFHLGHGRVSRAMLCMARQKALEFFPDLIAITGDFYDDGLAVEDGGLFGDWPVGKTFAVLGNHDHRGGMEHVKRLICDLQEGGARVLGNEMVSVELRGRRAWIAGVDDPYSGRDDVATSLAGVPDGDSVLLMLAHAPTVADVIPDGVVRLLLCGHTHGGQIRLLPSGRTPFLRLIHWVIGEPRRNEPSIHHGEHWVRGMVVSISNGLGMSQLPLRLRTRPQVTLIELDRDLDSLVPCDDVRRYVEDQSREPRWAKWLA